MQVARLDVVATAAGRPTRSAAAPSSAAALRTPDTVREVLGERGERTQPGRAVVGVVEKRPDERRADDHPVGVRRDLGGLVAVADAEAHAYGQLRAELDTAALVRATSGPARSLVVARVPVTPMTAVA